VSSRPTSFPVRDLHCAVDHRTDVHCANFGQRGRMQRNRIRAAGYESLAGKLRAAGLGEQCKKWASVKFPIDLQVEG
jgi:hypothetical protein